MSSTIRDPLVSLFLGSAGHECTTSRPYFKKNRSAMRVSIFGDTSMKLCDEESAGKTKIWKENSDQQAFHIFVVLLVFLFPARICKGPPYNTGMLEPCQQRGLLYEHDILTTPSLSLSPY